MPWYVVQASSGVPRAPGTQVLTVISAASQSAIPVNDTYVSGPYLTQALAQAALKNATGGNPSIANQLANAQGPVNLASPFTALGDIGNFFHALTQAATWERVGEVLAGGILLFVGVRALAQGSPVAGSQARKAVTKPAKKAAGTAIKIAAPEVKYGAKIATKKVAPKTTAKVAAHRRTVAANTGKRRPTTVRESHIYHHKGPAKP